MSDSFNDYYVTGFGNRDYDEITKDLYLGRIPCKNGFDLPDNIGMVVSVVGLQEMAGKGFWGKEVYSPQDWKEMGVEHLLICMQDLTADVYAEDLVDNVKKIKAFQENPDNAGKAVYVHCKAGRSRSAAFLAVYLAKYVTADIESALKFIKDKRPQTDVGVNKRSKAREALSMFSDQSKQAAAGSAVEVSYTSAEDYLSSLDAKDDIRQLTSFKELAVYATEIQYFISSCQRTEHVRALWDDITLSKDAKWFDRLVERKGATRKLLDADKGESQYGRNDKQQREDLITSFINDIEGLLAEKKLTSRQRLGGNA